jgi:hypothetical protein
MPLTDTRIRNAKLPEKPYKLADGGGLYIEIKPNGSRQNMQRFRSQTCIAFELLYKHGERDSLAMRKVVFGRYNAISHRQTSFVWWWSGRRDGGIRPGSR